LRFREANDVGIAEECEGQARQEGEQIAARREQSAPPARQDAEQHDECQQHVDQVHDPAVMQIEILTTAAVRATR
jgi:hypothetical protein